MQTQLSPCLEPLAAPSPNSCAHPAQGGERAGPWSSCFKTRCTPKGTRKLLGSFLIPKPIKEFSTVTEAASWWFGAFSLC